MYKRKTQKRITSRLLVIALVIAAVFISHYILGTQTNLIGTKTANGNLTASKITYGIAAGGGLPYKTKDQLNVLLKGIKGAGFTQVRFDMTWDAVQPNNESQYNWTMFDRTINQIVANGLGVDIILDRTPSWARNVNCTDSAFCPPADPTQFANFASHAVKRYSQNVIAWEVWNEPNTHIFWKPAPNPKQYTDLLKATYTAIKKQDPTAVVLFGGLSGSTGDGDKNNIDPRTFLSGAYALNAKYYFDALAYHPYTNLKMPGVVDPNNGWSKIVALKPSIRSIMADNNDAGKKIWLNEIGIPTDGPKQAITDVYKKPTAAMDHVTEAEQADFAKQVLLLAQQMPYVANVSWFSFIDDGTSKTTTENFYGLVRQDTDKKPAYQVFKEEL